MNLLPDNKQEEFAYICCPSNWPLLRWLSYSNHVLALNLQSSSVVFAHHPRLAQDFGPISPLDYSHDRLRNHLWRCFDSSTLLKNAAPS